MIKQLLLSSNYWSLNKDVVKLFGIETAFFLTNLAEAENMMADEDGWFYQTSETIEEFTTLSRYKQDKCIEDLEKEGILTKDVRGVPAKRYFKLDYEAFANKFVSNSQTGLQKTRKLDCKKLATNKESTYKESTYKESINKYIDALGDMENVLLTEKEYEKLKTNYPNHYQDYIDRLSRYVASSGKKYKSHYATILNWIDRDKKKGEFKESVTRRQISEVF